MAAKLPSGSSASSTTGAGRPRAQVAYEGEDEFSAMSLEPSRKEVLKSKEALSPSAPGRREAVKVDRLKQTNDNGVLGMFRRLFLK